MMRSSLSRIYKDSIKIYRDTIFSNTSNEGLFLLALI